MTADRLRERWIEKSYEYFPPAYKGKFKCGVCGEKRIKARLCGHNDDPLGEMYFCEDCCIEAGILW